MSTHINGLLIPRSFTLSEACEQGCFWREHLDAMVEKQITHACATLAVHAFDDYAFGLQADLNDTPDGQLMLSHTPASFAQQTVDQHRANQDDSLFAFSFNPVLIPASATSTLVIATGHETLQQAFQTLCGGEDYSYWDHSDKPEELTDLAWREREALWEKVLGHSMSLTPAEAGVRIKAVSDKYNSWWYPFPHQLLLHIQTDPGFSLEARATRIAHQFLEVRFLDSFTTPTTASNVMGRCRSFRRQLEAPPLSAHFKHVQQLIQAQLSPISSHNMMTPLEVVQSTCQPFIHTLQDYHQLSQHLPVIEGDTIHAHEKQERQRRHGL